MFYVLSAKTGKLVVSMDARKPHRLKLASYDSDINIKDAADFLEELLEGAEAYGAYVPTGDSVEKDILSSMGFKVVSKEHDVMDYMERSC